MPNNNIQITNMEKKKLASLVPLTTSLPDGRLVVIDTMSDSQMSETYAMIQTAAQNGNGFGVDEYSSEQEFREDISSGYSFVIMNKDNGQMVAAFMVAVSKFYRGCSVADPFIIVKRSERGKGIGEFCLQMCVHFARLLNFMGMYVDTFSNNNAMVRIINNVGGFVKVGCLPMGGKMGDGTIVSSLIFYKDLAS